MTVVMRLGGMGFWLGLCTGSCCRRLALGVALAATADEGLSRGTSSRGPSVVAGPFTFGSPPRFRGPGWRAEEPGFGFRLWGLGEPREMLALESSDHL